MRKSLRRKGLLLGASLAGVAVMVMAANAAAAPPAGSASNDPVLGSGPGISEFLGSQSPGFLDNQEELNSFFDWLEKRPGIAESGYIGGINDVPNRSTELMWKGDSGLQQIAIAEGSRRGIAVTVQPRKYSRDDLEGAAKAVQDSIDDPRWDGFEISSVSALGAEFDGLQVHGQFQAGRSGRPSIQQLTDLATHIAGTAVRIVPGQPAVPW